MISNQKLFNEDFANKMLATLCPLPNYFGRDSASDHDAAINYWFNKYDFNASIKYGASKLVILSPEFGDSVLKISFKGYFDDDDEWVPFQHAPGSDSADYCLAEYEKYKKLKELNLDCFVAKTSPYMTIGDVRVFIQEKITPYDEILDCSFDHPTKDSMKLAEKYCPSSSLDLTWIANCFDSYGTSKVKDFFDYCAKDLDILNDFYETNYGYRKNGTPALLDFSNFLE